jgi:hypothetical protein
MPTLVSLTQRSLGHLSLELYDCNLLLQQLVLGEGFFFNLKNQSEPAQTT